MSGKLSWKYTFQLLTSIGSLHLKLKLVSAIFYQFFIFSPNDSPLKTKQNVFEFI